jgi:lipoprotein-releasing system ATP-binding protein
MGSESRAGGHQAPRAVVDHRPADAAVLLRARGVCREFHLAGTSLQILRGVDLTLHEGEILVILGSSGAGKSTLLHILGGLDRPTAGTVVFRDEDLFRLSESGLARFRNRNLGFVFQFHHLLREFTAEENVMMPGLIQKQTRAEARLRARELLDEVGLLARAEHKPDELSGGEQQRVALARSLFARPRLVLADEPTGNLDPPTARTLHELMYTLARKHGQAWIVVTHNEQLAQLADTRTRLEDGVLIVEGPPIEGAGSRVGSTAGSREGYQDEVPEL